MGYCQRTIELILSKNIDARHLHYCAYGIVCFCQRNSVVKTFLLYEGSRRGEGGGDGGESRYKSIVLTRSLPAFISATSFHCYDVLSHAM